MENIPNFALGCQRIFGAKISTFIITSLLSLQIKFTVTQQGIRELNYIILINSLLFKFVFNR